MNERRFYVYVHKNQNGEIVYVGSGTGTRYKTKTGRSDEHLNSWSDLLKQIILDRLTETEARQKEEELISECLNKQHKLYNKSTKCRSTKTRYLSYEYFNKFLYLDETSPSFIRWKVDRHNDKNSYQARAGDVAGNTLNKNSYRIVTIEGTSYFVHKVIWVLWNKQDCDYNSVVDHIDGNPLNIHPNNLKKCSSRINNCNKKKNSRNKSGKTGVYLKNIKGDIFWTATWQDTDGKKVRKYFGVNKYGNQKAYELACEVRDLAIKKLIEQGISYTERHVNG